MGKVAATIDFQHRGIGHALADHRLRVPVHQRSYAWEEDHILDLFQDFSSAIANDEPDYFLGTIVLTQSETDIPEIADGQQRLATTSILLAAVRDYLLAHDNKTRAQSIENAYLMTTDLRTEEVVPRLDLNIEDREFFLRHVLSHPDQPDRQVEPTKQSNKKVARAVELAREHVEGMLAPYGDEARIERLIELVEFVRDRATIILVTVPDYINAYTMFETLNDRGLRIAQSDLLKNYLFGKSGNQLDAVQTRWAMMSSVIESISDEDLKVTYIRHLWITQHGPTRERELSKRIKETIASKSKATSFVADLADGANDYAALFNSNHEKWNAYGHQTRQHINIIVRHLRVEQIRPLMFAIARHFSKAEVERAFRMCVCWSVRFLIAGGRGGLLDRNYSVAAQQIGSGAISTAKDLASHLAGIIPTDEQFKAAFRTASVSKNYLARYYLRALEMHVQQDKEPELVPNEENDVINLEHILPEHPSSEWNIDPDTAVALYKRLGNMVLLRASVNSKVGNVPFAEKKRHLKTSGYLLTKMVANNRSWGLKQIQERQRVLAEHAVATWPLLVE